MMMMRTGHGNKIIQSFSENIRGFFSAKIFSDLFNIY